MPLKKHDFLKIVKNFQAHTYPSVLFLSILSVGDNSYHYIFSKMSSFWRLYILAIPLNFGLLSNDIRVLQLVSYNQAEIEESLTNHRY